MIRKKTIIQFYVRVFQEHLSICMHASFPFGTEGEMWNLIVSVPGHCHLHVFTFYNILHVTEDLVQMYRTVTFATALRIL